MLPRRWILGTLCVLVACSNVKRLERRLVDPDLARTLDTASTYLKIHLRDGGMYVLSPWQYDGERRVVSGPGARYDASRARRTMDTFTVSIDSVALFETNVIDSPPEVLALGIMTGVTAGVTIVCAASPKTCFGSCPTFYDVAGGDTQPLAEGFSASISPVLEARDVDALPTVRPTDGRVGLRMRNEALETQVVRRADLLVADRGAADRVLADGAGTWWRASHPRAPAACTDGDGGDCTVALAVADGHERITQSDPTNLAARESIELTFAPEAGANGGIVVVARQSLLPTFLLYQTLAYMGRSASDWLAELERGHPLATRRTRALTEMVGGIDIAVWDAARERWRPAGRVVETGPLASDQRVVPVELTAGPMRVRLTMTRGAWRIDHVGLARLDQRVTPRRVRPSEVRRAGRPDPTALERLLDSASTLVTSPGDAYELWYDVPHPGRWEVFLESEGYYLEWMRDEWIAEENPELAWRMFAEPAAMLERLAPVFKALEPDMERLFWGSRFGAPARVADGGGAP